MQIEARSLREKELQTNISIQFSNLDCYVFFHLFYQKQWYSGEVEGKRQLERVIVLLLLKKLHIFQCTWMFNLKKVVSVASEKKTPTGPSSHGLLIYYIFLLTIWMLSVLLPLGKMQFTINFNKYHMHLKLEK